MNDFFKEIEQNPGVMDHTMNLFLKNRDIFYNSLNILATGNSKFKSTVFNGPTYNDMINSYFLMMEKEL
jgi:hypothetical protein